MLDIVTFGIKSLTNGFVELLDFDPFVRIGPVLKSDMLDSASCINIAMFS